jgi:hypothetical protein
MMIVVLATDERSGMGFVCSFVTSKNEKFQERMLLKLNERENMVASLELSDAQFNAQLIAVAVGVITIVSVYFLFLALSSKLSQSPVQISEILIATDWKTEIKPALDPIKWQLYTLIEKIVVSPNTAS